MKKAKEMGVEMPKYFKPGAVNPLSYAELVTSNQEKPAINQESEGITKARKLTKDAANRR